MGEGEVELLGTNKKRAIVVKLREESGVEEKE